MNKTARVVIVLVLAAAAVGIVIAKQRARPSTAPAAAQAPSPPTAQKPLPLLIDLGSTTCIPCKMMAPVLQELKDEQKGRLNVEVIDVREDPMASEQYGVAVIPTQIFFDASGKELWRHEGFIAKEDIIAKWKEFGVELAAAKVPGE